MCFPQHHLQPTNQSATHLWSSAEEKQHVDFRRYQKNGLYMTILVNTGQWNKASRFQLGLKTDFLEEQLRSRWALFSPEQHLFFFFVVLTHSGCLTATYKPFHLFNIIAAKVPWPPNSRQEGWKGKKVALLKSLYSAWCHAASYAEC